MLNHVGIILAAGRGKRLKIKKNKSLLKIKDNFTLIENIIENFRKNNINESKLPFLKCLLFSKNDLFDIDDSEHLISETIDKIQALAGPGVNLHLLRHSGGSHLLARWYACRYPDFIETLSDADHWAYSEEGIGNLRIFFGEPAHRPLRACHTSAITHLIKLFGHATPSTFFQVYVHSFDAVASHALQRIHREEDAMKLDGKTIAALIPNMKSRTSQAKIKDRSVSALFINYLN